MNLLEYKAKVKELQETKYVSVAERLVREYVKLLEKYHLSNRWGHVGIEHINNSKLYYKLARLAYQTHSNLSKATLPGFIGSAVENAQRNILRVFLEDDVTITYDEFMDIFEFDKLLILPESSTNVEALNTIISDKPIHFSIKFNYSKSQFERYSTKLLSNQQDLVYAIRYKQVNFPDKPQTVWDMFLERCKYNCTKPITTDQTTLLKQHIKAINAAQKLLETNSTE